MRGAVKIEKLWRTALRLPRHNLVFVHLPKCAGTSFHSAIAGHYRASRITRLMSRSSKQAADRAGRGLLEYRRDLLIYELERRGRSRFLSGHWPVDADLVRAYRPGWRFVTLLRDPVERWLSHFLYNSASDGPFRITEPLEAFLETPRAKLLGSVYVRQLNGGAVPDDDAGDDAAVTAACHTLTAFDVVGTVERLDAFRARMRERCGLALTLGVERAGDPAGRATVTPEQRRRITELCAPDRAVHDRARSLAEP